MKIKEKYMKCNTEKERQPIMVDVLFPEFHLMHEDNASYKICHRFRKNLPLNFVV